MFTSFEEFQSIAVLQSVRVAIIFVDTNASPHPRNPERPFEAVGRRYLKRGPRSG